MKKVIQLSVMPMLAIGALALSSCATSAPESSCCGKCKGKACCSAGKCGENCKKSCCAKKKCATDCKKTGCAAH